jgi:hypothetical protein
MGWRGTLILALTVIGAGLYLYHDLVAANADLSWESIVGGPREAPPGESITHLLSFDPRTVRAVHLRRGEQEWRTERRAAGWSDVERASEVDDFLANLLEFAEVMPLDVTSDELAAHGLDPPEASIELERDGLPPVVLFLGRNNPPSTGVYAQLGSGRVVLTGALARWEFDKMTRALSQRADAR